MNCNCNCNKVIKATSYTVGDNFLINTSYSINSIENTNRFLLNLAIDLPSITTITPVYVAITIDGTSTNIPIQDIVGNNLMCDQLRYIPGGIVRLIYGSNPVHFKVLQVLPPSSYLEV